MISRWLAAGAAVVAAVFGAIYLAKAVSDLDRTASTNSKQSYDDREIAGGNSIVVDQQAAYQARALIPENARFRVVVGPHLRERTDLTETFVGDWFTYFLMPRRPADDASWIICYGCETSSLGRPYKPRWSDDVGISIGRLQ
jgi:hypothetical protein